MSFNMPKTMTDEMLARGIKSMLLNSEFTENDFRLLPSCIYFAFARLVRETEDSGELHGAIAIKIIKASMINAILDVEFPDEVEPL